MVIYGKRKIVLILILLEVTQIPEKNFVDNWYADLS